MPFAPKQRFRGGGGGGGGAVGLTDGQTMTRAGGGGVGGGGGGTIWTESVVSAFRGRSELVLGVAQMACTLLINHWPDDNSVSRVQ